MPNSTTNVPAPETIFAGGTVLAGPSQAPQANWSVVTSNSKIVAVGPKEEVVQAARLMSDRKIRRLAVVDSGKLIGVITENDIVRIWPDLIETTREYARLGLDEDVRGIEGHCEACGIYSTNLVMDRRLLLCSECRVSP